MFKSGKIRVEGCAIAKIPDTVGDTAHRGIGEHNGERGSSTGGTAGKHGDRRIARRDGGNGIGGVSPVAGENDIVGIGGGGAGCGEGNNHIGGTPGGHGVGTAGNDRKRRGHAPCRPGQRKVAAIGHNELGLNDDPGPDSAEVEDGRTDLQFLQGEHGGDCAGDIVRIIKSPFRWTVRENGIGKGSAPVGDNGDLHGGTGITRHRAQLANNRAAGENGRALAGGGGTECDIVRQSIDNDHVGGRQRSQVGDRQHVGERIAHHDRIRTIGDAHRHIAIRHQSPAMHPVHGHRISLWIVEGLEGRQAIPQLNLIAEKHVMLIVHGPSRNHGHHVRVIMVEPNVVGFVPPHPVDMKIRRRVVRHLPPPRCRHIIRPILRTIVRVHEHEIGRRGILAFPKVLDNIDLLAVRHSRTRLMKPECISHTEASNLDGRFVVAIRFRHASL